MAVEGGERGFKRHRQEGGSGMDELLQGPEEIRRGDNYRDLNL